MKYATHLYHHLPNAQGLCLVDTFTGRTVPCHCLQSIYIWRCPVYILDPHLHAGKKLSCWQPCSRQGVFLGFSRLHSIGVPLILYLDTGSITPQFHVSSVERENDPPDERMNTCSIFLANSSLRVIPHGYHLKIPSRSFPRWIGSKQSMILCIHSRSNLSAYLPLWSSHCYLLQVHALLLLLLQHLLLLPSLLHCKDRLHHVILHYHLFSLLYQPSLQQPLFLPKPLIFDALHK
jgi:hypothetical protein